MRTLSDNEGSATGGQSVYFLVEGGGRACLALCTLQYIVRAHN